MVLGSITPRFAGAMSHDRVTATPREREDRRTPSHGASAVVASEHDRHEPAAEALTVVPACDRVYAYTVPASSESTTTDLLHVLRDIVRANPAPDTTRK